MSRGFPPHRAGRAYPVGWEEVVQALAEEGAGGAGPLYQLAWA
ncbi:hypothetical protein RB628_00460 [Streptomyces sp. ADMS]|nr:hypothetical protein [Streptomyces sp. ADMS]MDW4903856.1 hypothetical protein [Streptomyces sp. ADMS]